MNVRLVIDVNTRDSIPGMNEYEVVEEVNLMIRRSLAASSLVSGFAMDSVGPEHAHTEIGAGVDLITNTD